MLPAVEKWRGQATSHQVRPLDLPVAGAAPLSGLSESQLPADCLRKTQLLAHCSKGPPVCGVEGGTVFQTGHPVALLYVQLPLHQESPWQPITRDQQSVIIRKEVKSLCPPLGLGGLLLCPLGNVQRDVAQNPHSHVQRRFWAGLQFPDLMAQGSPGFPLCLAFAGDQNKSPIFYRGRMKACLF